jgi:hypothetical protein
MLELSKEEKDQLKAVEKELAVRIIVAAQEVLEGDEFVWVDALSDEDFVKLQEKIIMDAVTNVIL